MGALWLAHARRLQDVVQRCRGILLFDLSARLDGAASFVNSIPQTRAEYLAGTAMVTSQFDSRGRTTKC
jgi:hypothetical protein